MKDAELGLHWPALSAVVAELRRTDHQALADELVRGVIGSSTSGEIYANVGGALTGNRALRGKLPAAGRIAWDRVLDDIERAYGMPAIVRAFFRLWRKL
jgi:hypothetical protein